MNLVQCFQFKYVCIYIGYLDFFIFYTSKSKGLILLHKTYFEKIWIVCSYVISLFIILFYAKSHLFYLSRSNYQLPYNSTEKQLFTYMLFLTLTFLKSILFIVSID